MYPQYDIRAKVEKIIAGWQEWASEEAAKKLKDSYPAAPNVTQHWQKLANLKFDTAPDVYNGQILVDEKPLLKSQQQIIDKIKGEKDFFGFTTEVLVFFLDAENAKEFFDEQKDFSDWKPDLPDKATVIEKMREYMDFAWEKAIDERGLSAGRSVRKFQTWLWLLDDAETLEFAEDDDNYSPYGKPILKCISEKYGFDIPVE